MADAAPPQPSPQPRAAAAAVTVLPASRGLQNMGNTCYANTTLQCLAHCIPLTLYFLRGKFEENIAPNAHAEEAVTNRVGDQVRRSQPCAGTPSLLCLRAYAQLLQEMCTAASANASASAFAPRELFKQCGKASWCRNRHGETTTVFAIGQQHDMAEFLQFILDIIHDTSHCRVHVAITGKIEGRLDQMMADSYTHFARHSEKQYSYVSDMMTGQYYVQNQTCDNMTPSEHSETYDPFTMLTLAIPAGTNTCTMYDCLDVLLQSEVIDGWKGELTTRARQIERKTYLWRLPQLLIVHLKRFLNRFVKNECNVQIATELDLSDYCLSTDNQAATYSLYAVGNHEGSLHFGHYYADCKNSQNEWHRFNDATVTRIDPSQMNPEAAYILFYYRDGA
jgi:ubiquitin C-terminal hydrolase